MKKAKLIDGKIWCTFPYDLDNLKMATAMFIIKGLKTIAPYEYLMPLTQENVEVLITHNFEVSDELMEFLLQTKKESKKVIETKIEGLKGELFEYQKQGVAFLERKNGRVLLADQQGCLSGDSIIKINRGGNCRQMTLRDVYLKFNNLKRKWDLFIPTKTQSLINGELRLNTIVAVKYSGIKKVVKVITESKKELILTPDHEVITDKNEWISIGKLNPEDKILVNRIKTDNRIENLLLTNVNEHQRIHGNYQNFGYFTPKIDTIISIEEVGETDTYDIVMEDPGRNFVANGIIVHNCGKTLQALAYLQKNPSIRPAVVVCPASLKLNWKAEAEKWTTIKAEVVKGLKPYQTKAELIIINYDIVHTWIETLRKTEFKCLILDESVAIKESTTRRTKAVKRLAKGIQHVIALSGTPILNKPSEIYNTLAVVSPGLFDSPSKFKWRYCNMKYNGFGWDYSGASHIPELHTILTSTVMLRRLKEDVLKDLPDKLFSFVPIEIDNEEEYIKAESDFIAYIREKKGDEKALRAERAQQFAKIEVLKQLSVRGKIKASMDWIDNLLSIDGKLVVFCQHHFVVDELMAKFKDIVVKLDGRDTAIDKNRSVERFQNEERIRLFVGNIKAAGSGLTLTASSNVAFMEYPWSPADLQQCADRCHRIGQKDTVNVYYLHGNNTIEERLIRILDRKKLVLDAMLDGIDTQEENLLTEIIKSYI